MAMTKKGEMQWREPVRPRLTHKDRAAELKKNPGQWAVVAFPKNWKSAQSLASSIRHGHWPPYAPAGTFEAVAGKEGRRYVIYARYPKPEGDDSE